MATSLAPLLSLAPDPFAGFSRLASRNSAIRAASPEVSIISNSSWYSWRQWARTCSTAKGRSCPSFSQGAALLSSRIAATAFLWAFSVKQDLLSDQLLLDYPRDGYPMLARLLQDTEQVELGIIETIRIQCGGIENNQQRALFKSPRDDLVSELSRIVIT